MKFQEFARVKESIYGSRKHEEEGREIRLNINFAQQEEKIFLSFFLLNEAIKTISICIGLISSLFEEK